MKIIPSFIVMFGIVLLIGALYLYDFACEYVAKLNSKRSGMIALFFGTLAFASNPKLLALHEELTILTTILYLIALLFLILSFALELAMREKKFEDIPL